MAIKRKGPTWFVPNKKLAAVIGPDPRTSSLMLKDIWVYIKDNDLFEDGKDKREIKADAKLLPIFTKKKIDMYDLPKLLSKNCSKVE